MIEVKFALIALYIICDAWMDTLMFHRPHNQGYWSVRYDSTNDSWHHTKKLGQLFLLLAVFELHWYYVLGGSAVIYGFHEYFFHYIFRSKK